VEIRAAIATGSAPTHKSVIFNRLVLFPTILYEDEKKHVSNMPRQPSHSRHKTLALEIATV
jgi:hypothetical protein